MFPNNRTHFSNGNIIPIQTPQSTQMAQHHHQQQQQQHLLQQHQQQQHQFMRYQNPNLQPQHQINSGHMQLNNISQQQQQILQQQQHQHQVHSQHQQSHQLSIQHDPTSIVQMNQQGMIVNHHDIQQKIQQQQIQQQQQQLQQGIMYQSQDIQMLLRQQQQHQQQLQQNQFYSDTQQQHTVSPQTQYSPVQQRLDRPSYIPQQQIETQQVYDAYSNRNHTMIVPQNGQETNLVIQGQPSRAPPWQNRHQQIHIQQQHQQQHQPILSQHQQINGSSPSNVYERVPPLHHHTPPPPPTPPLWDENSIKKHKSNKSAKKHQSSRYLQNPDSACPNIDVRQISTADRQNYEAPASSGPSFLDDPSGYLAQQTALLNSTIQRQTTGHSPPQPKPPTPLRSSYGQADSSQNSYNSSIYNKPQSQAEENPVTSSTFSDRSNGTRTPGVDTRGPIQGGTVSTSNGSPVEAGYSGPEPSVPSPTSTTSNYRNKFCMNQQQHRYPTVTTMASGHTVSSNTITSVVAGRANTATVSAGPPAAPTPPAPSVSIGSVLSKSPLEMVQSVVSSIQLPPQQQQQQPPPQPHLIRPAPQSQQPAAPTAPPPPPPVPSTAPVQQHLAHSALSSQTQVSH